MTTPPPFEHWPTDWPFPPGGEPVRGERGMVASTDQLASRAGVDVLADGGNAVDAVVAVSFALAVVNPEAGNLGGSGFMLVHRPSGEAAALDYRSVAPRAATPEMFTQNRGERDDPSQLGYLAVAVPGSVRGLADAHARFGTLPWPRLVEPAVTLARGFTAEDRLVRSYEPHIVDGLRRFASSAEIFLPDGAPPEEGDTFRQLDLAATLERVRDHGADGFYRGETAELLVTDVQRGGGILTLEDLAAYRAAWREPVRFDYRGRTVLSMPPSSSGGVTLAAMAHILSRWELGAVPWHGRDHIHLLCEAWRRAYADRNHYLADPDFVEMPLETLLSPAYGLSRGADISLEAATRSADVVPGAGGLATPHDGNHTTHVSIVDEEGSAVSMTTTLNTWYGSKVVAAGTGVLLNNEMDDFTARPGVPNHFGLVQGEANAIAPRKRMLSAMTPTLLLDGEDRLELVVGTPGGATITTTTFQVVSNLVDFGMSLPDAVAAPRVHHQHLPDRIYLEPMGIPPGVDEALRALGHETRVRHEHSGDVQAVAARPDGSLEGAADPRRGGVALGR